MQGMGPRINVCVCVCVCVCVWHEYAVWGTWLWFHSMMFLYDSHNKNAPFLLCLMLDSQKHCITLHHNSTSACYVACNKTTLFTCQQYQPFIAQLLLYTPSGSRLKHSTFFLHGVRVFMCFVWIWEQTAIISLYSINWLVFITETECVHCAVGAESLYVIEVNFQLLSGEGRGKKRWTMSGPDSNSTRRLPSGSHLCISFWVTFWHANENASRLNRRVIILKS
jgi:hypothetical protein